MAHPALTQGSVAVVTGGASGIGLAAAKRFAAMGLSVASPISKATGSAAAAEEGRRVSPGRPADVMALATDVSRVDDLRRLEATVLEPFGHTHVLMNNAGIQPGSGMFGPAEDWERVMAVNLWGVIHGIQVFAPG